MTRCSSNSRGGRGPEGHGAADRYRYGGRQCFLDMLGVFAEFETNLRRERQLEGIAKAKAAGVYKGRPPSIEASRVRELKAQGMRPPDIAKALKIGRASVYRLLQVPTP
jgi:DNA invertase Pin-like site-specific DNA recombinase